MIKGNVNGVNVCNVSSCEGATVMSAVRMIFKSKEYSDNLYVEVKDNKKHNNDFLESSTIPNGSLRRFERYDGKIHSWNIHSGHNGWDVDNIHVKLIEANIDDICDRLYHRKSKSNDILRFGKYSIVIDYYNSW